ncbi:MAG: T9SS type A sorting domain-containing protein [Bacteroidetes bacterium]|nr:T9SS type A sorting domain-containing protein [Bacteroidota bacterium]
MRLSLLILLLQIVHSSFCQNSFIGHGGVYFLGNANVPVSTEHYSNPNINGVVVRFRWNELEPTPGNFDWTYIDGEIAKATNYNKKVSLQPLSVPNWLSSLGVQQYYYLDKNPYHLTYGQILSGIIPWDSIYVNRYKILLENLATKYATNSTVTYVNAIGVSFSRNLPDSVITDTVLLSKHAFWTAYDYDADMLGSLSNQITDYYMELFPNTALWCSVDYVLFEQKASNRSMNYLASTITNYGIENYPDRFGLWREDLSGCNPNLANLSEGSHWYIMKENPCRIGAQMLWSVQDGPDRMNKCGIFPSTKPIVLNAAINKGLELGMLYIEIYGADILDEDLSINILQANNSLINKAIDCNSSVGFYEESNLINMLLYPNPSIDKINIKSLHSEIETVFIYNTLGEKLIQSTNTNFIDLRSLSRGIYFIVIKMRNRYITRKVVKQ